MYKFMTCYDILQKYVYNVLYLGKCVRFVKEKKAHLTVMCQKQNRNDVDSVVKFMPSFH